MNITAKPVFIKNNIEFPYSTDEYSFAIDILKKYLGENLKFTYKNKIFTIQVEDVKDLHTLQNIYHHSGKCFLYDKLLYLDGAYLKFEVLSI